MGIYYSSYVGYGFRVDLEKLKALDPEEFEEDPYSVLSYYVWAEKRRGLLSEITAGPYDASYDEESHAIVARSTLINTGNRDDSAFGVFMADDIPAPTAEERKALEKAFKKLGTGSIGHLSAFDCS